MTDSQKKEIICPGLPADWINAWLASVGATVLAYPDLRLHWTEEDTPVAVLSAVGKEPIKVLADAWPSKDLIDNLPTAKETKASDNSKDEPEKGLPRKATIEDFQRCAAIARSSSYSWTLTSTLTDLCTDKDRKVQHAPFDAAAPGPAGSLHERLSRTHGKVADVKQWIDNSLNGMGERVVDNGLGFDISRLASRADDTEKRIDPIIEVLAFFGLALLVVRGSPAVNTNTARDNTRQRGWVKNGSREREFHWPAWTQALDRDGIDALLSAWDSKRGKPTQRLLGITSAWKTVRFRPDSKSDPTRAFGSQRV